MVTALLTGVLLAITVLSGCGQSQKAVSKNDDHLTVYLWENRLMKNIVPYIHEQFPDQDIEFITGNNDTDLYSYFEEHGELPDIITVRRFSGKDAQDLEPYLMDFASYDVVSRYYSYALQYYKNSKNEIQWLPICGIPQTIIANKTLFEQYGIKIPKNYKEYARASPFDSIQTHEFPNCTCLNHLMSRPVFCKIQGIRFYILQVVISASILILQRRCSLREKQQCFMVIRHLCRNFRNRWMQN